MALARYEERLKAAANKIVGGITKMPILEKVDARERLRDTIRSESFVKQFESQLAGLAL